jgi:hypothetical protein
MQSRRTPRKEQDPSQTFIVMSIRQDGRERAWREYRDRFEAQKIANGLTALGCRSRVVAK